jgi:hypothetical protein
MNTSEQRPTTGSSMICKSITIAADHDIQYGWSWTASADFTVVVDGLPGIEQDNRILVSCYNDGHKVVTDLVAVCAAAGISVHGCRLYCWTSPEGSRPRDLKAVLSKAVADHGWTLDDIPAL